jgi:hypothetical protein
MIQHIECRKREILPLPGRHSTETTNLHSASQQARKVYKLKGMHKKFTANYCNFCLNDEEVHVKSQSTMSIDPPDSSLTQHSTKEAADGEMD